ncbi:hypothetical protein CANCADRAFT_11772, partial [Tortispora caseinolytica NRRL Y-17796]
RKLHGRFLHITDIHPDPYYQIGSDPSHSCHRGKGDAGRYGAPLTSCDVPYSMIDQMFKWIRDNLKDNIDFVVWTGDNVRHDRDRNYPRTEPFIFAENDKIAKRFLDIFYDEQHDHIIPVVPTMGNNDVYPHNLMAHGPTLQTGKYLSIWRPFIPHDQSTVFSLGAYHVNEVIPNKLAVISLNSLYYFSRNPLIDGCESTKDPGYHMMKWLTITLTELRRRKMKVWLMGHVPLVSKNTHHDCLRKFAIWQHEFRDIIVGGLYGHMNIDHFVVHDAEKAYKELKPDPKRPKSYNYDENVDFDSMDFLESEDVHILNRDDYMAALRDDYASLKEPSSESMSRFSISNNSPSIITTFFPSMRVWEYNIEGLNSEEENDQSVPTSNWDQVNTLNYKDVDLLKKKKKKRRKPSRDDSYPPYLPPNSPLGPAYSSKEAFSPTRYIQYFSNISKYSSEDKAYFDIEYATDESPYNLTDLTVSSWIQMAHKLSLSDKSDSLWAVYLHRAFVSTG